MIRLIVIELANMLNYSSLVYSNSPQINYIYIYDVKIYRNVILPVVLYGCETLSLTLREERRLRVFENRVLRRVFGPKGDEVTGEL